MVIMRFHIRKKYSILVRVTINRSSTTLSYYQHHTVTPPSYYHYRNTTYRYALHRTSSEIHMYTKVIILTLFIASEGILILVFTSIYIIYYFSNHTILCYVKLGFYVSNRSLAVENHMLCDLCGQRLID